MCTREGLLLKLWMTPSHRGIAKQSDKLIRREREAATKDTKATS